LEHKKFRDASGLFIAEGAKTVGDLLQTLECELIIARSSWMATQGDIPAKELEVAESGEISKISLQKTPQDDVFAVFRKPTNKIEDASPETALLLALDGVQDPGNLGSIVRLCAWFGIEHLLCSPDCADAYGPKSVQASMGALSRVKVHYYDLPAFITDHSASAPVYGAFLDGKNIYEEELTPVGIIVMGNEGAGIRSATAALIGNRLRIPSYSAQPATDSLNVATATAVVCAEFRRRFFAENSC